jgi:glycosyltransferase involved in cell wall biosynthesis
MGSPQEEEASMPDQRREKPRCSVIIATYQRLRFFKKALHSALRQTEPDIEVIVVANGCTDGTVEYLRSLEDPRIVPLIYDEPLGATGACITGLRAARGRWRGFLHDDDLWAPAKLEEQLRAVEDSGRTWAYTGCVYIDGDNRVMGGVPAPDPQSVVDRSLSRYSVPGGMSSLIWRDDALDGDGLLDANFTYMVDWDLSLRLLRSGPPAAVSKPLVAYRQHGGNLSLDAADLIPREQAMLEAKYSEELAGRSTDLAFNHRIAGSEFMRAGMRKAAITAYLRALRMGDWGTLARLPAVFLPQSTYPALRRRFLSDDSWMTEGQTWLDEISRDGEEPMANGPAVRARNHLGLL